MPARARHRKQHSRGFSARRPEYGLGDRREELASALVFDEAGTKRNSPVRVAYRAGKRVCRCRTVFGRLALRSRKWPYELLLRGTDSDRLRHDYVECERQTLRLMATETVAQVHERLAEKMTEQKLKPVLDAVWLTLTNDLPRQTLRQTHEVDSANKRRHRIRV